MLQPLVNLPFREWWFQRHRGCATSPPPPGEFLELPAGGNFTVELAGNLAFTTLRRSPPPQLARFGDGANHTLPFDVRNGAPRSVDGCISSPNLHTKNEEDAAGSAFAISYQSDLANVTLDNLVVFTVRYNTPFYRLATFDVPKDMPPCPEEGCHCAWLWIANGCGQDNMFMNGLKCKITNSTSTRKISTPQRPVYCKDDPDSCVKGAKEMIAWKQLSGNNYIARPGQDRPGYNANLGFQDGAQNDIFEPEEEEPVPNPTTTTETTAYPSPTSIAGGTIGLIADGFIDFASGNLQDPRATRNTRRLLLIQ